MASNNMTAVLFLLALIYSGLLWLGVARTYQKMIKLDCKVEQYRVFKVFYGFIAATLILTIVLYFISSLNLSIETVEDKKSAIFLVILFYFLPAILMVLDFALMYYQLELLMTMSRISGGEELRSRLKNKKLAVIMRVLVFTIVAIFIAT